MAIGRVGREFRVTRPKEVREFLKLDEGDELVAHATRYTERIRLFHR